MRRMLGNLGYRVLALKRIRIGSLSLGDLRGGNVHELSAQEAQALLNDEPDIPGSSLFKAGGISPSG